MKKKNKHGRIDFGMRAASPLGVISSCLIGAETILFLAGVYVSYLNRGAAGVWIGAAGFAIFVLAVIGFVAGICGLLHREYHHGPDWFGTVGNGLILAGICTLFVTGTMV